MNFIQDFISLFFPHLCYACGNSLFKNEEVICIKCLMHLPETNFHKEKNNPVSQVFWGRIPLESATALFYYRKGGSVQALIHQLKYHGHKEIGIYFGKMLGNKLMDNGLENTIDQIIPIPLHRKKLKKRGFNQAEVFALGLGKAMNIVVNTKSVVRKIETSTQTKKSRYKRWENVSEIFQVTNPESLANQHILLVDDVITTGATMEACLQVLYQVENIKLSVASIAFAS